jgi:hypothetical protein
VGVAGGREGCCSGKPQSTAMHARRRGGHKRYASYHGVHTAATPPAPLEEAGGRWRAGGADFPGRNPGSQQRPAAAAGASPNIGGCETRAAPQTRRWRARTQNPQTTCCKSPSGPGPAPSAEMHARAVSALRAGGSDGCRPTYWGATSVAGARRGHFTSTRPSAFLIRASGDPPSRGCFGCRQSPVGSSSAWGLARAYAASAWTSCLWPRLVSRLSAETRGSKAWPDSPSTTLPIKYSK